MKKLKDKWIQTFPTPSSKWILIFGFCILIATFFLNNVMSTYADKVSGPSVHDLFLDAIPEQNVDFIFFWVALAWCITLFIYHLFRPAQLSFLLWGFALFIIVRSFFITLTHLGPPVTSSVIPPYLTFYSFHSDMFFSGHVGGPFFFALLTSNRVMRTVALAYTLFMIVIVLIAHTHYSIDIFASLFISHSLSVIMKKFENKYFFNRQISE